MIDREKLAEYLCNAECETLYPSGYGKPWDMTQSDREMWLLQADYLLDRLSVMEKGDAESRDQQKFQESFRAGTGCSAECIAVVQRAEEYIRNYDQVSYEFLRGAVLDLVSARDFE